MLAIMQAAEVAQVLLEEQVVVDLQEMEREVSEQHQVLLRLVEQQEQEEAVAEVVDLTVRIHVTEQQLVVVEQLESQEGEQEVQVLLTLVVEEVEVLSKVELVQDKIQEEMVDQA